MRHFFIHYLINFGQKRVVAAETRIKPVTHNGMTTVGTCLTANCGCSMLYIGIQFTPQDIFCIERNKKGTEDEKRKRKMFLFLILLQCVYKIP